MGSIDEFHDPLISPNRVSNHFEFHDIASVRLSRSEDISYGYRSSQTANDARRANFRAVFDSLDSKNSISHCRTPLHR